jgi:hypothetical protein
VHVIFYNNCYLDSFLPWPHNIKRKSWRSFQLYRVECSLQGGQNQASWSKSYIHAIKVFLLALPTTKALKDSRVFRFINREYSSLIKGFLAPR